MAGSSSNTVEVVVKVTNQTSTGIDAADKSVKRFGEDAAQAGKKANEGFDSAAKGSAKFGASLKDVGKIAAGVLAADMFERAASSVKNFVTGAVAEAKDLGESINAVQKIFGKNADAVEDWAQRNSANIGLSMKAFNQLATPLGALLKNSGFDLNQVSDQTIKLTRRAADMASVFNKDVSDALEAIQAGLRGESDPLEQYGVSLSQAKVEARALADTGKTTTAQLSAQEIQLARLNLIFDQTADSAGDFAGTSDQVANASRIAAAQIDNAKAALAASFLPVIAKAATLTGQLAKGFSDLPKPLQASITVIAGGGAAIGLILPKIAAVKTAMSELSLTMGGIRTFLLGPWGMALTLGAAVVGAFASSQSAAASRAQELADVLNFQAGAFDENNRTVIANRLEQEGALKTAQELGIAESDLVDAILGNADAQKRLNDAVGGGVGGLGAQTNATGKLREQIAQMTKDVDNAKASQDRKTAAVSEDTKVVKGNTGAISENTSALKDNAKTVEGEFDPTIKMINAFSDVTKAQGEYNAAKKKHGAASDEARAAELKLASAIVSAGSASAAAAGTFNGTMTPALHAILKAGGLTEKQIKDIGEQFDTARAKGDKYAKTYQATAELQIIVHDAGYASYRAGERNPGAKPPKPHGKRSGGPVGAASGGARGGLVEVGEEGNELVRLPYGSTVIPHGQSEQMIAGMSGGGGVTTHRLVIDFTGAENKFKSFMRDIIKNDGGGDIGLAFS